MILPAPPHARTDIDTLFATCVIYAQTILRRISMYIPTLVMVYMYVLILIVIFFLVIPQRVLYFFNLQVLNPKFCLKQRVKSKINPVFYWL